MERAMAQALVAGLPPRRTGLDPRPVHVGLVTDKVAQVQGFYRIFQVYSMSIIPPITRSYLSTSIM